jgi:TusA-related sulfurtransferase
MPLLAAKRFLDDLPDGRALVLISDCPGAGADLQAWAETTGHEVRTRRPLDGRRVAYTICRRVDPASNPSTVLLDERGCVCPGPLLAAKQRLDRMRPGEVLVLLSDCVASPSDIAAWSENTSVELLDQFRTRAGHYEFYLRRRGASTETPA